VGLKECCGIEERRFNIRAVLLHAISDAAKRFYEKAGFLTSAVDPMTMMITLSDVEKALDGR
jgi:hypothetical protein